MSHDATNSPHRTDEAGQTTTVTVLFREFGDDIAPLQKDLADPNMLATEIENHLASHSRYGQAHIRVVVTDWDEAIVYAHDDEVGRADILY